MGQKVTNIWVIIRKDFRGVIFWGLKKISRIITVNLSTNITYLLCVLKDVKIGKNTKFYGIPIIDRRPLSEIVLGKNCIIRSDITTNLARVKKSIIRTYNPNAIIRIGDNTGINGSIIAAEEKIVIGRDVLVGYNCYICDSNNHVIDPTERHTGKPETSPINIGDNVWLGLNVVVLKGVSIGSNSIIGANSLVNSDIPSNVIAMGNPCKVVVKKI